MNQNTPKVIQFNFSRISYWLTLLVFVLFLGSIGLGWLVKSLFILLGLILIAPAIAFFVFRWWVKRNLVEDQCPVCSYKFTGFNHTEFRCPSCKESLKAENGHFRRLTPPGTIDVEAVEVSAQQIED